MTGPDSNRRRMRFATKHGSAIFMCSQMCRYTDSDARLWGKPPRARDRQSSMLIGDKMTSPLASTIRVPSGEIRHNQLTVEFELRTVLGALSAAAAYENSRALGSCDLTLTMRLPKKGAMLLSQDMSRFFAEPENYTDVGNREEYMYCLALVPTGWAGIPVSGVLHTYGVAPR